MSTNYNIIWSSPKLDQKLDFYCWETLMATNLRTHNIWSFVEMRLAEEVGDTSRRWDQSSLYKFNNELPISFLEKS